VILRVHYLMYSELDLLHPEFQNLALLASEEKQGTTL